MNSFKYSAESPVSARGSAGSNHFGSHSKTPAPSWAIAPTSTLRVTPSAMPSTWKPVKRTCSARERRRISARTDAGKLSTPAICTSGGYYSWDRVQTNTPGFLTDLFNTDVLITADQHTQTGALFGQAEWPITRQLTLTTGLRYTDESRSYVGGTTDTNPTGFSFLCAAVGACAFGAPGPHVLSFEDATIGDRNLSWRAALDLKPTDESLLYVSASRAEKSGGFFDGITTNSFALAPFKPEILTDYEAGAKAELFDRRLLAEASVFYYDYQDLQTQTFTSVGAVSLIKLGNVRHASLYGLDADMTWHAAPGLDLKAGLGLLHSSLGSLETQIGGTTVTIPAGNKLPDARPSPSPPRPATSVRSAR